MTAHLHRPTPAHACPAPLLLPSSSPRLFETHRKPAPHLHACVDTTLVRRNPSLTSRRLSLLSLRSLKKEKEGKKFTKEVIIRVFEKERTNERTNEGTSERASTVERSIRRLIRPRPRHGRVEGRGREVTNIAIRREGCYSPRAISS